MYWQSYSYLYLCKPTYTWWLKHITNKSDLCGSWPSNSFTCWELHLIRIRFDMLRNLTSVPAVESWIWNRNGNWNWNRNRIVKYARRGLHLMCSNVCTKDKAHGSHGNVNILARICVFDSLPLSLNFLCICFSIALSLCQWQTLSYTYAIPYCILYSAYVCVYVYMF